MAPGRALRLWPTGLNQHFGAERDLFKFQCMIILKIVTF